MMGQETDARFTVGTYSSSPNTYNKMSIVSGEQVIYLRPWTVLRAVGLQSLIVEMGLG